MAKPLEGVRILDLSTLLAGPFGSMILADLGADVIKIELPGREDQSRHMPPHYVGATSAYFIAFNRGKRSLALDLKDGEGYGVFLELVKRSDVVYDNFRPGVIERLRADYETLRKVNPRIISASVTGYGQTGPDRGKAALDLIVQARGGIMSFTGEPGRPPVRMGIPMGDMGGGLFAAHGVLAALLQRERTGQGQKVDVSLLDCQIYLASYRAQYYLTGGEVAQPLGTGHASVVPIRAYECGDGKWVVIDCALQHFWERLCEALGRAEWLEDPKMLGRPARLANRGYVDAKLANVFRSGAAAHWIERMEAHGVPCGPIQTIDEALADPQVGAREMVVEMTHPELGRIQAINTPIKTDGTWRTVPKPPPLLGEHTEEILHDVLGMPPAEIARLRRRWEGGAAGPGK
ncbi:MAG: CoA transferase [Candidatus Tectomicrobia bacterium]|nr:CoA transferase [Candidatus Tectomicrobia bacterium]